MLFNSIHFLAFFPIVFGLYLALPRTGRARLLLLLGASYYFYMSWKPEYAALLLLSTAVDYYVGIQMGQRSDRRSRRPFLLLSLAVNLGMLFTFKYFNFFNESLRAIGGHLGLAYAVPALNVLLPVGISFYVFQSVGYIVDVYRGEKEAERDPVVFALYVSFWPQLVSGPIERAGHLLPQFHEPRQVTFAQVVNGFALVLWGFFMKLVLADNISPYVDRVYGNPAAYTGGHYVIASYLFIYQVFCDFAGYSSIAIGVARMLGFDLMQNFRRPFFSRSWAELWTRWHVSLMTWFRDYIYKSLRNKEAGAPRAYFNLFVVFLASGLWHGAAWTFVIWGLLNWGVMAAERAINNWSWAKRLKRPAVLDRFGVARVLESLMVTTVFATTGIFFRAGSLADATYIFRHLGDLPRLDAGYLASLVLPFTSDYSALAMGLCLLACAGLLEAVHLIQENRVEWLLRRWRESTLLRGAGLVGLLLAILFLGKFDSKSFIYFQF